MDRKFLAAWALFVALMVGLIWASVGDTQSEGRPMTVREANLQSGATIAPGSGVSVIAIIDVERFRPVGNFSFEPKIVTLSQADVADPGGTGKVSGTTIVYRYGVANRHLSVLEWEAKGRAGTTIFHTMTLDSGNSDAPVAFVPNTWPVVEVAILVSGATSLLLPKGIYVVQ